LPAIRPAIYNEVFAYDVHTGRIVSRMTGMWEGQCVTASSGEPPSPPPAPPLPPTLSSNLNVWPIPSGGEAASGPPLALSPNFTIPYDGNSRVASAGAARYTILLQKK
jgi:hypothetical protein